MPACELLQVVQWHSVCMNGTLMGARFLVSPDIHFSVSAEDRYFSHKIFLELISAVSVYIEEEFKFLLWPVARPHFIPSQV